ncbi:MAG: ATP-binding cassette domain-containing protein [Bacteroidales bacterium]|nr:ATP-binding cassette domain-containing protein [Bacteroidales bacterium]
MSESILKALMQLFAIIAASKEDSESTGTHSIVVSFLEHELRQDLVEEYVKLYHHHYDELRARQSANGRVRKVVSANSTKVLVICDAINKELVQRQKVILLVRMLEFVKIDNPHGVSDLQMDFVSSVALNFNVPHEEFKAISDFVFLSSMMIPDSNRVLLVDSDYGFHHDKIKHIYSENLSGQILFFVIPSVNMHLFVFQGENEITMNGQVLNPDRVHVLSLGASLRGPRIKKPIYYSDIVSTFNYDKTKSRIVFEVDKLEYKFPNGATGLHTMSFIEKSGKLVGIMGASGAGKTTLLSVLNGNSAPSSGHVWINGVDLHNNEGELDGLIGYVSQDDLLIEDLTVFQNLYYSAKQCFSNYSRAQLYRTVLKLLKSLGLYEIRNMKVGNPLNKRISGGQRKRLNIALELIREPSILFLDEPTSGLSSRDSENILDLLKELTNKGKLVFVVIHQPSSEIFKMFDSLLILDTGGFLIYKGDPVESITYFKSRIRQANWNDSECPTCGNVNPEQIFNIVEGRVIDEYGNVTSERKVTPKEWNDYFVKEASREKRHNVLVRHLPKVDFKIPDKLGQFGIFVKRDVLSKFSNMQYVLINLLETPLIALILTFIIKYRSVSKDALGEYQLLNNSNLPVYLFMAVIIGLFVGLTVSAQEIIKDRTIRKREQFLNLSSGAYLLSKVVILLFISAYQAFVFVLIGNSILEIHDMYFKYWLMLFAVWVNANVMGLNISDAFKTTVTIYILIPFLIIPQIMLTGVLVSFDKLNPSISKPGEVPFYGDWFVARWAYEGLAVEQFIHNSYEEPIYEYEKTMQNAIMKRDFWLTILENKINNYERIAQDSSKKSQVQNDVLTMKAEILQELEDNPSVQPEFNPKDMSVQNMDHAMVDKVKSYFSLLRSYYIQQFKMASKQKDQYISDQQTTPEDRDAFLALKRAYHNESLSDFVTNNRETERVVEYGNRIYQKANPIYLDPHHPVLRAHFYAPRKRFMNWYIETYWLNLAVIWGITIVLVIMLHFSVFRKLLSRIESVSGEYNRKREARIIKSGTEVEGSAKPKKPRFKLKPLQDWSIWR